MAASNVFGEPITNSTLEGMPEYANKVITSIDLVRVALNIKIAGDTDTNATQYVENLEKESGLMESSTICKVYNATGDTVTFVDAHDWRGHIRAYLMYPLKIENGQSGIFCHEGKSFGFGTGGSSGAVVYRGKNTAGENCDWMLSWSNTSEKTKDYDHGFNKAYTEIGEVDHFKGKKVWDEIAKKLAMSSNYCTAKWNGCLSVVEISDGPHAKFSARMALLE